MNRVALLFLAASSMALTNCRNVASPGEDGGTCYPNDTCNAGLICVQGLCTLGNDAATQDAAPSPDSTPGDVALGPDLAPDLTQDLAPDLNGCIPEEPFCRNDKIRRCADDGKASMLLVDCTQKASHQCAECPEGFVCQAPSMIVQAKSTGVLDFDLQSYPGACDKKPDVSATFNFASNAAGDKLFSFYFHPSADEMVSLNQHFEMVSGQAYDLRPNPTSPKMVLGVSYQTPSGDTCLSNYSGATKIEPSNFGSAKVIFAGKDPGDTFSLSAQGYVTCDMGLSWKPFSLAASGVLTR